MSRFPNLKKNRLLMTIFLRLAPISTPTYFIGRPEPVDVTFPVTNGL